MILYTHNYESIKEAAKNEPPTEYSFERRVGQTVRLASGAVGKITRFNKQLTWVYCESLQAELIGLPQTTELIPEQQRFI